MGEELNTVFLVLVSDEEVLASGVLVFVPNEIGDGFVFGLFGRGFVALVALAEELFLDEIDS